MPRLRGLAFVVSALLSAAPALANFCAQDAVPAATLLFPYVEVSMTPAGRPALAEQTRNARENEAEEEDEVIEDASELGGDKDFRALCDALHRHGMGLVLDFVPNHMRVGGRDNAWWLDVLEWGRESPFAEYFDINWDAVRSDLKGRVLLPVLGEQYGAILEKGEITLRFDPAEGSFSAWYYEPRFPISPRSYPLILAEGGEVLAEIARDFATIGRRPRMAAGTRAASAAPPPEAPLGSALRADFPRATPVASGSPSRTPTAGASSPSGRKVV